MNTLKHMSMTIRSLFIVYIDCMHVYDIVYIDSDNLARGQCKWCLQGVQRIDNNGKKLPARPSVRWQQSEGVQAGDP